MMQLCYYNVIMSINNFVRGKPVSCWNYLYTWTFYHGFSKGRNIGYFFFCPIMLHHQALQNLVAWNNHCLLFLISLWVICTVLLVWGRLRWSQLGSLLCLGQLVGQLGAGESEDKLGSALSGHGLAQTCSLGEGRRKRENRSMQGPLASDHTLTLLFPPYCIG